MMGAFNLSQTTAITEGELRNGDCRFDSVCTDSRSIKSGDLFVALRGDNFDAHQFLAQVADKKACGLVVERAVVEKSVVENLDADIQLPQLVVDDTTKALGALAKFNRQHFGGPVIGITGSCGKTTVKTMLRNILSLRGNVLATSGNFNNHIGVPLTLFQLEPQHQFAVIEMGASGPNEIDYLSSLAQPDVVVITNALQAHIEGFGSVEGIVRAKGEIYTALKEGGVAVLNLDDNAADFWMNLIGNKKLVNFSVSGKDADFTASNIVEADDGHTEFTLNAPDQSVPVRLQLLGRQNIENALAAAACAFSAGTDLDTIKRGLELTEAVAGRMKAKPGLSGCVVIDDSYNANPDSVRAAIDSLSNWKRKKILVLGDMGELGPDSVSLHAGLGDYAAKKNIDQLVTVGVQIEQASKRFCDGRSEAQTFHGSDKQTIINYLKSTLDQNTVVLVKGSRFTKMEEVVAALTGGEK